MRDTRRSRVVLSVLLVLSLTIVVLGLRGGGDDARDAGSGIFGPVESAAAAIVSPVRDFLSSITSLGSKDDQIATLQAENDRLRTELNTSQYARARAQELDDLLGIAGTGQYRIVPAQVVAYAAVQGFGRAVTISAGSIDGVTVDQTVINGQGLIGKVVSVARTTSVVQLITDATSTVGGRLEASPRRAVVNGTGDPSTLSMSMLDPLSTLSVGQRLVTSSPTFAPGVPIGTVTAVGGMPGGSGRTATVTPFADLTALDLVGVIVDPPRTDPLDSVLPPAPSPSVSADPSASTSPSGSR